jgi:methyl-accepting chemotaxis protein
MPEKECTNAKPLEIQMAIKSIDNSIQGLAGAIEKLSQRTDDISRSPDKISTGEKDRSKAVTNLGETLFGFRDRIDDIRQTVESMIQRIEL